MTTQELKEYINSKLGNSLRTLLPSYWWKRLFGLVVDRVEEVDNKVEDLKNSSDCITFYLTSDPDSEWAKKNYNSYLKARQTMVAGNIYPILIQTSHDEKWRDLFMDLYVTGGIEDNGYMLTLPKVQFGRSTCNIHLIPYDTTMTCEVERLTFDDLIRPGDTWIGVKQLELQKELVDVGESIPVQYLASYDSQVNTDMTPITIDSPGPTCIYGFVGNSTIIDGKIESVNLSSITISGQTAPNYELKIGWYDNEGKFNEPIFTYDLARTKICSSEISVLPGKEYAIVSETNNFGIEIFEYDEQKNFIQKTTKFMSSTSELQLPLKLITFTENTKYITFNLYNHGNDLSQTDIAFLDTSQPYDSTRIHYGTIMQQQQGYLRGLPGGRDTMVGSVLIRRVGTRNYKEGDVNSDYLLTDGTTTLYVLNPDEYETSLRVPKGISFLGTGLGCTISSNIPMGICKWSNIESLYLTQFGSSSKTYDANLYSEMLNKQDSLISGTNIKTINGESILGSGDITVSVDLDGFINQEDLTNYHKYQSPYVVDWSADQSGTILHPGYYYFSDPTYLNLSGLPANPMGVYSIVLDNFSEDSSLNIVYPTNFRWTNGEPDFASLSGTTSVLELSILVLNDTDTVSNRKVLATWAIF